MCKREKSPTRTVRPEFRPEFRPETRIVAAFTAFIMTAWAISPVMAVATLAQHGRGTPENHGIKAEVADGAGGHLGHLLEIEDVDLSAARSATQSAGRSPSDTLQLPQVSSGRTDHSACAGPGLPGETQAIATTGATSTPRMAAGMDSCCCNLGIVGCTVCEMNGTTEGSAGAPAFKGTCGLPGGDAETLVPSALTKFFFQAANLAPPSAPIDRSPVRSTDVPEDLYLAPSPPPPQS